MSSCLKICSVVSGIGERRGRCVPYAVVMLRCDTVCDIYSIKVLGSGIYRGNMRLSSIFPEKTKFAVLGIL